MFFSCRFTFKRHSFVLFFFYCGKSSASFLRHPPLPHSSPSPPIRRGLIPVGRHAELRHSDTHTKLCHATAAPTCISDPPEKQLPSAVSRVPSVWPPDGGLPFRALSLCSRPLVRLRRSQSRCVRAVSDCELTCTCRRVDFCAYVGFRRRFMRILGLTRRFVNELLNQTAKDVSGGRGESSRPVSPVPEAPNAALHPQCNVHQACSRT